MLIPSAEGRGLVNLVAELEARLTGVSSAPRLEAGVARRIPDGPTAVLVLFDGLGADQARSHPAFRRSTVDVLHAPFPTTTTVSMATIATGRVAAGHGVIGHMMWLPEAESVVNVLKFVTPFGKPVDIDTTRLLPTPNLWERLRHSGIEPVTVQPAAFDGTPLSRALYRGCRFEGVWNVAEMIDATVQLAAEPGRFVFTYWPSIDVAAHVSGQGSADHRRAMADGGRIWERLSTITSPVVGTADHGHVDYTQESKLLLRDSGMDGLTLFGDSRSLMVGGSAQVATGILDHTGATLVTPDEFRPWFGDDPRPHPQLAERLPDLVALAPDGRLLLPKGFDRRLIGYHGGLDRREVEIPLLVH